MKTLGYSSKLNAEWSFLRMLRDAGRDACASFLDKHRDGIGVRSTVNLDVLLEGV
jgi:NTE family protein